MYSGPRSGGVLRQWQNETPPGGLTELYVYHPDTKTVWPDDKLGSVFSPTDPRCFLPGNTGIAEPIDESTLPSTLAAGGPSPQFIQVLIIILASGISLGLVISPYTNASNNVHVEQPELALRFIYILVAIRYSY